MVDRNCESNLPLFLFIGLAEVAEAPRIQPEPAEQLPFIRETEKFAGDQLRVKLRVLRHIRVRVIRKLMPTRSLCVSLDSMDCALESPG